MSRFTEILESLERHGVEYVVVGGLAAVIHGAPVLTMDIDTLVEVSEANAARLLKSSPNSKVSPPGRRAG